MVKHLTAFEKALTTVALSRYQTVLENDSAPVQFSDEHNAAVAELTKKTRRAGWKYVNKPWKRILVAVIVLSLLLATVCAAVPAIREGLIRFFTKDDGIVYSFEFTQEDLDRAPKEIAQYYAPTYVPPQYTLADESFLPTDLFRFYLDESGNVLSYMQHVLWEYEADPSDPAGVAKVFGVNAENGTEEDVVVHGYEVGIFRFPTPVGTEDMAVVWTDHEYFYFFSAPSAGIEEIEKIIGSMVPVTPK